MILTHIPFLPSSIGRERTAKTNGFGVVLFRGTRLAVLLASVSSLAFAQALYVSTFAGTAGNSGTVDGTGPSAKFNQPMGIVVDGGGNIYVSESPGNVIRKITPAAVVTTIAGAAGTSGSSDGIGASARFFQPGGLALDAAGNLFIADRGNHVIRKLELSTGAVTTLAGTAGISGTNDGSGAAARFTNPQGVCLDSSGTILYVADTENHLIRKIDLSSQAVTTVAGGARAAGYVNGGAFTARFNKPYATAVDNTYIYVVDQSNYVIRRILISTGEVSTLAGSGSGVPADGSATSAAFYLPADLWLDSAAGVLLVADAGNNAIRRVVLSTGAVSTVAGLLGNTGWADGIGTAARFAFPRGITGDSNRVVYIADTSTVTIRKAREATLPAITKQATGVTVQTGTTATFTIEASGVPAPTYLWQRQAAGTNFFSNLADDATFSGTHTASLSVNNVTLAMQGDQFRCAADTTVYPIAVSNAVTLSVVQAPAFTSPASGVFVTGTSGNFAFQASGYPSPTFAVISGVLPAWANLNGTTGVVSGTPPDVAGAPFTFTVQASNGIGSPATQTFTLNVITLPTFTAITGPRQVVTRGGSLTLSATVANATTLQWKRNGSPISGATSASYTINDAQPLRDTGWYQLVATNASGSVTSGVIFVNAALAPPRIKGLGSNVNGQLTIPYTVGGAGLSAGDGHTLSLRSDGTVVAWGVNANGQCTVPNGLSEVVSVAAGFTHSLALKSDGTVVGWGSNSDGQTTTPTGLGGVVGIAAGGYHSVALKSDGTVVVWGRNSEGQTAVPAGLSSVVAVAAGYMHCLALKSDGTVVGWGLGSAGQTTSPAGLSGVAAIAAGGYHSLALKGDGTVTAWGNNIDGQVVVPTGLNGVVAISAGFFYSLALKSDGKPVAWGAQPSGAATIPSSLGDILMIAAGGSHSLYVQDGAGDLPPTIVTQPLSRIANRGQTVVLGVGFDAGKASATFQWRKNGIPIPGEGSSFYIIENVADISGSSYDVVVSNYLGTVTSNSATVTLSSSPIVSAAYHGRYVLNGGQSLALTLDSSISSSATVQWKRSGIPISNATARTFTIANATPFDTGYYQAVYNSGSGAITSGPIFVTVAASSTQVVGWGYNSAYQIGFVSGLSNVISFKASRSSTQAIALRADGTILTNGPTAPTGFVNIVAVEMGSSHGVALKADGEVFAWGNYDYGQTNVPFNLFNAVAIAAGANHSLALKGDGTVVAWGDSRYGATAVPAGLTNVVAISAGDSFSLALKADGTVVGWGLNSSSQSTIPSNLAGIAAISAGGYHSLALNSNGTVVGWGGNGSGQISIPSGLANIRAISAGSSHSLALNFDRTIVAWGSYTYGESTPPAGLNSAFEIAAGASFSAVVRDASGDLSPTVAMQPASTTAFLGQDVTLSVSVTAGTALNFYQWRKNGQNIAGATNAALLLPRLTAVDAGNYDVVAANQLGTVTSAVAVVSVNSSLAVAVNYTGRQVLTAGQSITLSASSPLAGPVTYQWRRNGINLAGATNANFAVTGAWNTRGVYDVVATNGVGPAFSSAVFVVVTGPTNVQAWGTNSYGANSVPGGLNDAIEVAAGFTHSLALKADGTVVAWGTNNQGQMSIPAGLNNVVAISAAANFSMALRGDGTVATWGQLNYTPSGLANVVAIVATPSSAAMALRSDGTVVVWDSSMIRTEVLAGVRNVVGIAGGGGYSSSSPYLAVKSDGTVAGWGLSVPSSLTGVVAVRAGIGHGLALKNDATVATWGDNGFGQTTVPAGLGNVVNLAAGDYASYAIKADGSVVSWGNPFAVGTTPPALEHVLQIAVESSHALALRDASSDTAPTIVTHPTNSTAMIGGNVTFSVAAAGTPAPTYQWQRQPNGTSGFANLAEGGNYFFVTTPNLSVTASSLAMTGDQFRCVVTNYVGSAVSNTATLTVTQAPVITSASSTTFAAGQAGSFTVTATGAPAPTFTLVGDIPGWLTFNSSTGVMSGTPPDSVSPFTFTIQASNSGGTTTQNFTLNVTPPPGLVNLSSLFFMPAAGASSTFTITGPGTKTMLIRGVGPTLSQFGVSGVLADPQLLLYNTSTGVVLASNDNWGGTAQLTAAFAQIGAFTLAANSKDAALLVSLGAGTYTVNCSGANATTGNVILEIYDAGGSADTKLYYVSLKTFVSGSLSVGFAFSGSSPRTALVRAAGPSLGIPGALNDPSLTLYSGGAAIASNDNWNAADAAVFSERGAFPFAAGSKDSALTATLAPGSYTAQVTGVGGTSGTAMVEVFDASVAPAATVPYFLFGPASQGASQGANVTLSALAAGTSPITYQWRKNGADISGATNSTLTLSNVQGGDSGFYEIVASSSAGSATANGATLTVIVPMPPTITSATGGGAIILGQSTSFTVVATGTAPFTYQWRKDGAVISGATNSIYAISNVQLTHAGTYDVLVSNVAGTSTSAGLPLTVVTLPPTITTQPVGGTVGVGGSFTFSTVAGGSPTLTYQWRRNGINLPWATSATFGIPNAQSWDDGDYTVVVTNPYGSATSASVHLIVVPRPVALSARVVIGAGDPAIATFTVEGPSSKNLLLRVVGPGITPFGNTNVVPDPQIEIFNSAGDLIALNNDWGAATNATSIASTTAAVGAFALAAGSRDSAVLQAFAPGSYTVRATGNGGVGGAAYLELYDTDLPANASRVPFAAVRARMAPGDAIIVGGLASNGRGVRSYLIRSAGPALGLAGAFANPSLIVAREGVLVGSNDDWDAIAADGTAVSTATSRVAAFPFPAGSRDAAIVVTGNLHAGAHTVQVGGASGAGTALLELHDLDATRPASFAPVVVSPPLGQSAAIGDTVSLAARAHGTGPLSYQWRKYGVNVAGATAATLVLNNVQPADGGSYAVVVTNSLGTATSLPALVTVGGAGGAFSATHAVLGGGYVPGGTVTITNTLSFTGTPTTLGWDVAIPTGWAFVSDAGSTGQVKPAPGATGTLGWAWSEVPSSPVTFTYTLAVPAAETSTRNITATGIVRSGTDSAQNLSATPNPLTVVAVSQIHSADTNQDFQISLFELTRVIELYNTRNGTSRTGAYKIDANGEDGFGADGSRASGLAAALVRYHSADTRGATSGSPRDGAIDLFELTRVIELYNYRVGTTRTGQYHVQAGTEDGFAPGP